MKKSETPKRLTVDHQMDHDMYYLGQKEKTKRKGQRAYLNKQ